jgi:hypothetical protein
MTQECIHFDVEKRPVFQQVTANLELLMRSLPKIQRCQSEPTMNRAYLQVDGSDFIAISCASPRTPLSTHWGIDNWDR